MNGTIKFNSLTEMAEFLKEFTGSTAKFEAYFDGKYWVVEFNGGF